MAEWGSAGRRSRKDSATTAAARPRTDPPAADVHPWDGFLTGPENALAHAAAGALARDDEGAVSPLVVHGASGTGKSRLLAGLVAEHLRRHPGAAVAHLDAETFAAFCAEAASHPEGWAELRGRFRAVSLFVLDDLSRLGRLPLALAELVHTLDALAEAGAAVAVSAATSPAQWNTSPSRGDTLSWPPRLLSRLQGGLAVGLDPPGPALRRRYVLDRAHARGIVLASEAIDLLAEAADGFRTIDGWVARLALGARLDGRLAATRVPLRRDQAEALLADELSSDIATSETEAQAARTRSVEMLEGIARVVARQFGVSLRELRGSSRRAALVLPRHLAIALARQHTGLSFAVLGRYFGRRDTKTIRHACRVAEERLRADPALASVALALGSALQRSSARGA